MAAQAQPAQRTMEECDKIICTPGSPFEVVTVDIDGRPTKVWKNTPTSFRKHLLACMDKFASRVMVNTPAPEPADPSTRETFTFAEIKRQSLGVAAWLVKQGVRANDPVGLVGFNSAQWVIGWTAIHLVGAVPVMVNAAVQPDSMLHCLKLARPRVVLADAVSAATLSHHQKALSAAKISTVVSWQKADHLKHKGVKVVDFSNMGSSKQDIDKVLRGEGFGVESQTPESDGVIFFTSGTTGYPKAVVSSQRAALHNVISSVQPLLRAGLRMGATMQMIAAMMEEAQKEQAVVLLAIPMFHVTGCLSVLLKSFSDGHQLVLMRRFNPDEAVRLMVETKVNIISAVPAIILSIMQHPKLPKEFPLAGVSYGGAPAPSRMPGDLMKRWPEMNMVTAWGMTETNAPHTVVVGPDYLAKSKSCGYPLPVAEVRIVDIETNKVLGANKKGQIQARGMTLMKGYFNDEKATREAIDKDGWFNTGDAGYLDDEGFLYIADRIKDIIIRGGENISSEEVENAIYLDDRVSEAAAVPVPDIDGVLGELVAVAVSLKAGQSATPESIMEAVRSRVRSHARPVFIYVSEQPLPRNANGKLIKTEIKKLVGDLWKKKSGRKAKL